MNPTTHHRSYESLAHAADRTGVSIRTLRRRIACGQLAAYRTGRLIRVDPGDVDRLLAPIPTGFSLLSRAAAWADSSASRAPAGPAWSCGLSTRPPLAPGFSTGSFSTRSFPRRVAPWLQPAGMAGGWNPFRRFSCAIGQLTH